jgi:hypothetical protein
MASTRYRQVDTVLSPINVERSTSARHAVNEWLPRGPRIFEYLLTTGAQSTLEPERWQCAVNVRQACEQRVVTEWSPADRAWRAYDWGGPVTLRSWYSERIPIQYHIKNTSRRRRGGAEWVPGGYNELWPLRYRTTLIAVRRSKKWNKWYLSQIDCLKIIFYVNFLYF